VRGPSTWGHVEGLNEGPLGKFEGSGMFTEIPDPVRHRGTTFTTPLRLIEADGGARYR
jgi:hypothetical protein